MNGVVLDLWREHRLSITSPNKLGNNNKAVHVDVVGRKTHAHTHTRVTQLVNIVLIDSFSNFA